MPTIEITNRNHGQLPLGFLTQFGRIEAKSLTAYRIDGEWVPFLTVHGPYVWVEPLVAVG